MNDRIPRSIEIGAIEAEIGSDPRFRQASAGEKILLGVTAADPAASVCQQQGKASHSAAFDSDKVDPSKRKIHECRIPKKRPPDKGTVLSLKMISSLGGSFLLEVGVAGLADFRLRPFQGCFIENLYAGSITFRAGAAAILIFITDSTASVCF